MSKTSAFMKIRAML